MGDFSKIKKYLGLGAYSLDKDTGKGKEHVNAYFDGEAAKKLWLFLIIPWVASTLCLVNLDHKYKHIPAEKLVLVITPAHCVNYEGVNLMRRPCCLELNLNDASILYRWVNDHIHIFTQYF